MKKIWIAMILALMLSFLLIGSASAKKGKVNIKGEVTAIGAGTLTILSNKGETFVVTVPAGFDLSSIQVGDSVLVKAEAGTGGAWLAQSIKKVGNGNGGNDDDDDEQAEGSKLHGSYCADGKQTKSHPLAARLAERYGVTENWVMGYFCDGYGMGAIMLALKTSQMEGVTLDADALLASRADGKGWGQIWKDLGLIGSEREGHSPPGLLKKPGKRNR